jgi:transposase
MCWNAQPPWPMPAGTAAVGEALLKDDSPYRLTGDQLFEHLCDTDFTNWYSTEGKPGISPVILAFVTVCQFREKLPDRQAAEALWRRLDWKYALHLPRTLRALITVC